MPSPECVITYCAGNVDEPLPVDGRHNLHINFYWSCAYTVNKAVFCACRNKKTSLTKCLCRTF